MERNTKMPELAEFGFALLVLLGVVLAVVGAAAELSGFLVSGHWPKFKDGPLTVGATVLSHPYDPTSIWRTAGIRPVPPAWLVWAMAGLVVISSITVVLLARRWLRSNGSSKRHMRHNGFASSNAVRKTLGDRATHRKDEPKETFNTVAVLNGLDLGCDRADGQRIVARSEDSTIVSGASRSGKTSGLLIPNVVLWKGSSIVTSTRPELYNLTAALRPKSVLFDPTEFVPGANRISWSPVEACIDPLQARLRARSLMLDSGAGKGVTNGNYFEARGTILLRCLLHAAALTGGDMRTVLEWVALRDGNEPMRALATSPTVPEWANQIRGFQNTPPRELASTYNGVEIALDAFSDPRVLRACCPTSGTGFDMLTAIREGTTAYICGEAQSNQALAAVFAAFVENWVDVARHEAAASPTGMLTLPTALFLDEAAQIAPLPSLPEVLSDGGGCGIMTVVVLQSLDHAKDRWGDRRAQKMWNAASVKVVLGGGTDDHELEMVSRLCGEIDEDVRSTTHSEGHSAETLSHRRRRVIEAGAIRALPEGEAIVLYRRNAPICTHLIPWWDRKMRAIIEAAKAKRAA